MRDMRALIWLLGLLLPLVGGAADSWAPAKRVDTWLDQLAKDRYINGSLAVSGKGRVRCLRSVGFAGIEYGAPQPGDAGTRCRIGPVSRIFTETLTMLVVETVSIT